MAALTLDQIAEKARNHRTTPAERRARRVSLIMGLRSKKSTLTRDEVQSFLDQMRAAKRQKSTANANALELPLLLKAGLLFW
jgi:hypothetical protein